MKHVSIDFDGTLEYKEVQDYVQTLVDRHDVTVWITTRRFPNKPGREKHNQELYRIARKLSIPEERITFCSFKFKFEHISDKNFIFHLDDDPMDLELLAKGSNNRIKCIQYVADGKWRGHCERFLK
jgi:hypothetical protein